VPQRELHPFGASANLVVVLCWIHEEPRELLVALKLDPARKSQCFDGNVSIDCSVEGARVFGKLALSACRAPWATN
jgi:hypothetical protein